MGIHHAIAQNYLPFTALAFYLESNVYLISAFMSITWASFITYCITEKFDGMVSFAFLTLRIEIQTSKLYMIEVTARAGFCIAGSR